MAAQPVPMHPNEAQLIQKGFLLSDTLPASYQGIALADSATLHAKGPTGELIFQQADQSDFSLRLQVYQLFQPMELLAQQGNDILIALLAIKNTLHFSIQGLGSIFLRPGQFALLHLPATALTAHFEQSEEYHHLEIAWSANLVRPLLPYFPSLQPALTAPFTRPFFIGTPGRPAGPSALHLAQEILRPALRPDLHSLYLETKVREYLLFLLAASDDRKAPPIQLDQEQQEKLIVLAERLRSNTAQKFPIAQLALEANMNEKKLKRAFKALFGKGIFEYHLDARMNEAYRLLEETNLATKVIAAKVGYDHTASFITKFREYFGYPPNKKSKR